MSTRVLLIEDNATNLELMTYLLDAFGYTTTCASDGIAGLEAAQSGEFDLVLTDILMPQLDGWELARAFKRDSRLARIPLVAVTALAMTGDRERIMDAGFDGYISKPIDPQCFRDQIEAILAKGRHGQSSGH